MRPGRGVMATTRSASRMASVMLWVTKTTVFLCVSQMRISSKPSSSRVIASSAANGSSISSTEGSWISARQSDTRCCMPPDNSRGKRLSNPPSPTRLMRSIARGARFGLVEPEDFGRQQDVVEHRAPLQQHGLLEHDADVAGRAQERRAVEQQLAARRPDERADQLEQGRFSAAGRADQRDEFVLLDREIDILQGRHPPVARA